MDPAAVQAALQQMVQQVVQPLAQAVQQQLQALQHQHQPPLHHLQWCLIARPLAQLSQEP